MMPIFGGHRIGFRSHLNSGHLIVLVIRKTIVWCALVAILTTEPVRSWANWTQTEGYATSITSSTTGIWVLHADAHDFRSQTLRVQRVREPLRSQVFNPTGTKECEVGGLARGVLYGDRTSIIGRKMCLTPVLFWANGYPYYQWPLQRLTLGGVFTLGVNPGSSDVAGHNSSPLAGVRYHVHVLTLNGRCSDTHCDSSDVLY